MENLYIYVLSGVIVLLFIIILVLIFTRQKGHKLEKSNNLDKKEERRRRQMADKISADIKNEFDKQKQKLIRLKNQLKSEYETVGKTYVSFGNNTNPSFHNELCRLFDLNRDDYILYCRRYEKWLGSDTFFIILEDRIGYAPRREPLPYIWFDEIEQFNASDNNEYVEISLKNGEVEYIESEDFTYNGTQVELASILNNFINRYKTPYDIYFDACGRAIDERATPIIPTLIDKVSEYNKNWGDIFTANYKLILCEDGIDVNHNAREATDAVNNILKLTGAEDSDDNVINGCLVLKAKLMLVTNEEHTDIKKVIDTVLGSKCEQFVKDEAYKVRRKLIL